YRPEAQPLAAHRQLAVEVHIDQSRSVAIESAQTALVLEFDQLRDTRAAVADDARAPTTHGVEQVALEEKQPVLLARCLALDQNPSVPTPGAQPCPPQVVVALHAARDT